MQLHRNAKLGLRGRFELDTSETSQTCLLFEVPNREAPEGLT